MYDPDWLSRAARKLYPDMNHAEENSDEDRHRQFSQNLANCRKLESKVKDLRQQERSAQQEISQNKNDITHLNQRKESLRMGVYNCLSVGLGGKLANVIAKARSAANNGRMGQCRMHVQSDSDLRDAVDVYSIVADCTQYIDHDAEIKKHEDQITSLERDIETFKDEAGDIIQEAYAAEDCEPAGW